MSDEFPTWPVAKVDAKELINGTPFPPRPDVNRDEAIKTQRVQNPSNPEEHLDDQTVAISGIKLTIPEFEYVSKITVEVEAKTLLDLWALCKTADHALLFKNELKRGINSEINLEQFHTTILNAVAQTSLDDSLVKEYWEIKHEYITENFNNDDRNIYFDWEKYMEAKGGKEAAWFRNEFEKLINAKIDIDEFFQNVDQRVSTLEMGDKRKKLNQTRIIELKIKLQSLYSLSSLTLPSNKAL